MDPTTSLDIGADENPYVDQFNSMGYGHTTAAQLQADLGALASDVAAAPPGSTGSTGSTIPNLVGTYSGSAKTTAGNHVGRISTLQVVINSEGADGSLTGTLAITYNGQTNTLTLTGQVTAGHAFSATGADGGQNNAMLNGTAAGNTIVGTYASTGDSGTFTLSK